MELFVIKYYPDVKKREYRDHDGSKDVRDVPQPENRLPPGPNNRSIQQAQEKGKKEGNGQYHQVAKAQGVRVEVKEEGH